MDPEATGRRVPGHRGDARSVLHVEVRDDAGPVAAARREEPEPATAPERTSAARSSISAIPVEQVSWEDCDLWLGRLGLIVADRGAVGVRGARRDDDAEVDRDSARTVSRRRRTSRMQFCRQNGGASELAVRVVGRRLHACTRRSARSLRIRSGCTTCSATCGSGAATGTAATTCAARPSDGLRSPVGLSHPRGPGRRLRLRRLGRALGVPVQQPAREPRRQPRRPSLQGSHSRLKVWRQPLLP